MQLGTGKDKQMTLKECYILLEGDYEDVLHQMIKEERIRKYVLMFLKDDSYQNLRKGMEEEDYDLAFLGAHTLKGVCRNLAFTKLGDISSQMTEYLRNKNDIASAVKYLPNIIEEYEKTIHIIQSLDKIE